MRTTLVVTAAVPIVTLGMLAAAQPAPATAATARALEERFLEVPSPDRMREAMRRLSARPHHVGSAYDRENAEWIRDRFREFGWEAEIETFEVLFPTPKERLVEMVAPTHRRLSLEEPKVAADPTSGQKAEQLPTYNAYSKDGDVTGTLVYVNYGLPEDYERLERLGISAEGAIVLARYGHSWRGIKPKVAAEHGAVGCLIYSDPRDDGYFGGDVFPKGPMRPEEGVQRGSVMDFPAASPGDPLTPGIGATAEATRLPLSEAKSLTRIPVLPISYGDARPLAGGAGNPLPRRPGPGEGAPEGGLRLEAAADPQRHRPDPRRRMARRMGAAGQPPRRLGQRGRGPDLGPGPPARGGPGPGPPAEAGLAAQAHPRLLRLGR